MFLNILLQAAEGGGGAGLINQAFIFVAIIGVFYFFMIRPQQKQRKEQKGFIEAIKKGDDVVTIGGLHGTVYEVNDSTVVLEVEKGQKLTFEKTSVSFEASKRNNQPAK